MSERATIKKYRTGGCTITVEAATFTLADIAAGDERVDFVG